MNDKSKLQEMVAKAIGKQKNDGLKVIGIVRHEARHADGTKFLDFTKENTVMNVGKAVISGLVGNVDSQVAFGWLAVGSGTTAPAASQTALTTEITTAGAGRAAATKTRQTTTTTNDTIRFVKSWSISGTITIEEIGIFNDADAGEGVMLGRQLTGTLELSNGDTYQATYDIIFA